LLHIDNAPRGTRGVLRPREQARSCDRASCDPRPGPHRERWRTGGSWWVARAHCIDTHITKHHEAVRHDGRAGHRSGAEPGGAGPSGASRSAVAAPTSAGWKRSAGIRMMGAWWMPWRWRPTKDAATRRNAPGRRWQPVIRGSPNGATRPAHGRAPRRKLGRAPGELKHLSTPRNREDSLSSGERTGRSPNPAGAIACRRCLWGVGRVGWRGRQPPRRAHTFEPKTAGTGHRRG
jgi:hypothetical protein